MGPRSGDRGKAGLRNRAKPSAGRFNGAAVW